MNDFLNIQETAKFTGKSEITIRRLVDKLKKDGLEKGILKQEKAARGYSYSILKDFLIKHFKIDKSKLENDYSGNNQENNQKENLNTQDKKNDKSDNYIVDILRKELENKDNQLQVKDEQLKEKDIHIGKLLDRQQESNVLMQGLQHTGVLLKEGDKIEKKTKIDKSKLENDYSGNNQENNQKENLNTQDDNLNQKKTKQAKKEEKTISKKKRGFWGKLFN
jgi:hypothetical protein